MARGKKNASEQQANGKSRSNNGANLGFEAQLFLVADKLHFGLGSH